MYHSILVTCQSFDKSFSELFSAAWICSSNELSIDFNPWSPSFRVLGILAAQLHIRSPQLFPYLLKPSFNKIWNCIRQFNLFFLLIAEASHLSARNDVLPLGIFDIGDSSRSMTNCANWFSFFPHLFGERNGNSVVGQIEHYENEQLRILERVPGP